MLRTIPVWITAVLFLFHFSSYSEAEEHSPVLIVMTVIGL